jgi:hypothetical protein
MVEGWRKRKGEKLPGPGLRLLRASLYMLRTERPMVSPLGPEAGPIKFKGIQMNTHCFW